MTTSRIVRGMVFALETWKGAEDGSGAARIEEEVVVTKDGCQIITNFPLAQADLLRPARLRRVVSRTSLFCRG